MNGFQLKQVTRAQKEQNWKGLDDYDRRFIADLTNRPKMRLTKKQNVKLMKITGGMG